MACTSGADSLLHAGVTIYDDCVVGKRAILHSGVVIGADGFGFARDADRIGSRSRRSVVCLSSVMTWRSAPTPLSTAVRLGIP
jgi:UDP-3-O-[3-hydroxymyristoyl] glucosamine N-acyltransferase